MRPEVLRFAELLHASSFVAVGDASDEEPDEMAHVFAVQCNLCKRNASYSSGAAASSLDPDALLSDTEEEVSYPHACPMCKRVRHEACAVVMLDRIRAELGELPDLLRQQGAPAMQRSWCSQLRATSFCCWCATLLHDSAEDGAER